MSSFVVPLKAAASVKSGIPLFFLLIIISFIGCCLLPSTADALYSSGQSDEDKLIELLPQLVKLRNQIKPRPLYHLDQADNDDEFDNEWVVQIVGGLKQAKYVARTVGYKYIAPVKGFKDIYIFSRNTTAYRSKRRANNELMSALLRHKYVLWVEQQRKKRRMKRDFMEYGALSTQEDDFERHLSNDNNNDSRDENDKVFNDPFWSRQWNLRSSLNAAGVSSISMHVIEAWKLGYTGKGVVVTILDDGIQYNHTDLISNYDPLASYDLNDNDYDPMPTFNALNRHGTRCAGEVAMIANNSFCGVGIAYEAHIGGVRMLDGKVTDRVEAEALSYNIDHIDIYSASWGPNDDGKTLEGPGVLAERAILKGILHGRKGKGVIYVWASGNGGLRDDDCDCDGYMDSIYTFSVSSVTEEGIFPWYAEKCAATLTTTYSTGSNNERMIITTDVKNECATDHSGTSASAPMAAAIIALGLQANPSLTWRDVQHIAVWTSDPIPLLQINEGWSKNARGLYVNSRFGFGMMDAEAFVLAAKDWQAVPKQNMCTTVFPSFSKRSITDDSGTVIKFQTNGCSGQKNEINFIEHIQLALDARYPIRGHLSISITSPQGTQSQLLTVRREDNSPAGFKHWPFMSVHTWGENPRGIWQLHVQDKSGIVKGMSGIINNITLYIYGTNEEPFHYRKAKQYRISNETDISGQFKSNRTMLTVLNNAKRILKANFSPKLRHHVDGLDRIIRYVDHLNQHRSLVKDEFIIDDFLTK